MFLKTRFLFLFLSVAISSINSCHQCDSEARVEKSHDDKAFIIKNAHVPDYEISPEQLRIILEKLQQLGKKSNVKDCDAYNSGSATNSGLASPAPKD